MKDETLKKFREEYTTCVNAYKSNFSEIKELKEELENDPITIQIKELQEKLNNDPRTKKLEKLNKIKEDVRNQNIRCGHWGYADEDYAYFATKPSINDEDSYGILARFSYRGERDIETYCYLDIENLNTFTIEKDKADEFEKGHIIIPVPSVVDEEEIIREFFVGCVTEEPKEVAKTLAKKYNTRNEEE